MTGSRWLALLALCPALFLGCTRPVSGRSLGATQVSQLEVVPNFIRAGVPVQLTFRLSGAPPAQVSYEIAGTSSPCAPTPLGDGRFVCVHPGLSPSQYGEGSALVALTVTDDGGQSSVASVRVTIDFECPRIAALAVTGGARGIETARGEHLEVAAPDTELVLSIEATEALAQAPLVQRSGRPWVDVTGSGRSFLVKKTVTPADASAPAPIVVRAIDLAGNSSGDCLGDGQLMLAIDQSAPLVDQSLITIWRDVAGVPSTITASIGAFIDDVGIRAVRVYDETGTMLFTELIPEPSGAIPSTSLRARPESRVLLEAVDYLDRTSGRFAVPEGWRLSLGDGSTPGAALRTAVRFSPAPAESTFLENRTQELAADVFGADGLSAEVRGRVGFHRVGDLPYFYEDRLQISAAYDRVGDAIVAFGGGIYRDGDFEYTDRTIILRWSERDRSYYYENGPAPAIGSTPPERRGGGFVFDGNGCGVLFGGDGVVRQLDGSAEGGFLNDVWQICGGPGGYRWKEIHPDNVNSTSFPLIRISPLAFDPINRRFFVVHGESMASGRPVHDLLFLNLGEDAQPWHWDALNELPADLAERRGHFVFWDPRVDAFVIGLGFVTPYDAGQGRLIWTYKGGQWSAAQVPVALAGREEFGSAFDTARGQYVLWGGESGFAPAPTDDSVWLMTRTSSNGVAAWRNLKLDVPLPRYLPAMVFDERREEMLVFGGYRGDRFVPAELYALDGEPSWPYVQATIALGAPRPSGIERLELVLGALGRGDADGTAPGRAEGQGIEVLLWDAVAQRWELVAQKAGRLTLLARDRPERFVTVEGRVTMSIRPAHPATALVDAHLSVDQIDGALMLSGGTKLPGG